MGPQIRQEQSPFTVMMDDTSPFGFCASLGRQLVADIALIVKASRMSFSNDTG